MFYPIPVMRWPISIARVLGNTTAKYRWLAVVYLSFMFFLFPITMFGLSMAGSVVVIIATSLIILTLAFSVIVTKLQTNCPGYLPSFLRSWDFLPLCLHSLDPWDRIIMSALSCCCSKRSDVDHDNLTQVIIDPTKTKPPPSSTPLKDFPSVVYNKLPHPNLNNIGRTRSSNSFTISTLQRPVRTRTSNSFSNSLPFTDLAYHPLAPTTESQSSKSPTPGGSSGEL